MLLRIVDDGNFRDMRIEEGAMFLLPGSTSISIMDYADLQRIKLILLITRFVSQTHWDW